MRRIFNVAVTPAVLAFASLVLAQQARAQEAVSTTTQVAFADLDLTRAQDAAKLQHRIEVAVRQVCGPAEMLGAPDHASYEDCVSQARTQAADRVAAAINLAHGANRYAAAEPGH